MKIILPTLHNSQKQVVRESKRFNVLKNGRRWGKSTLATILAINTMIEGGPVGYWCPTYKDIFEIWRDVKYRLFEAITYKSEQTNHLEIATGGKIDFWSMDDPNSGRGRKYKLAIIDEAEKSRNFQECFDYTIRPTLADYRGDCWVFSTPKGQNTYFHQLYERKSTFDNWMSWQKGTIDNPHISPEEIEEARLQLDPVTFRQEYLGESVDYSGMAFAHAFKPHKHVVNKSLDVNDDYPLYLSFDFNHDPVTCTVWQHYEESIFGIKEFSSSYGLGELCDFLKDAIGWDDDTSTLERNCFVTGDRSGWSRSELLEGQRTAYDIIQQKLGLTNYQIDTPKTNPNLLKSRELVNGILEHYPEFIISGNECPNLIFDLKYVAADDKHQIIKDRNKKEGKADFIDTMRYYLNTYHQTFIRI